MAPKNVLKIEELVHSSINNYQQILTKNREYHLIAANTNKYYQIPLNRTKCADVSQPSAQLLRWENGEPPVGSLLFSQSGGDSKNFCKITNYKKRLQN